jgi:hypothetical protein
VELKLTYNKTIKGAAAATPFYILREKKEECDMAD